MRNVPGSPKKRAKRLEVLEASIAKARETQPDEAQEAATANDGAPARARPRPPSMTDEQLDAILAALSAGVNLTAACASARFSRTVLYDWMKADPEFGRLIDEAREGWAAQHARYIAEHADWRARSWLLGVRLPKEYAETSKLAGHDGGPLLADAELLELARRAFGASDKDGGEET